MVHGDASSLERPGNQVNKCLGIASPPNKHLLSLGIWLLQHTKQSSGNALCCVKFKWTCKNVFGG